MLNKSTTVLEAPRVGCAMDGVATDVYCLKGGYDRGLRANRCEKIKNPIALFSSFVPSGSPILLFNLNP